MYMISTSLPSSSSDSPRPVFLAMRRQGSANPDTSLPADTEETVFGTAQVGEVGKHKVNFLSVVEIVRGSF
jgi:hypothetical protein